MDALAIHIPLVGAALNKFSCNTEASLAVTRDGMKGVALCIHVCYRRLGEDTFSSEEDAKVVVGAHEGRITAMSGTPKALVASVPRRGPHYEEHPHPVTSRH